ncbi:hypothetical protein AC579_6551 [Pseudocercospora musae]|uniref:Uncharacterized protein n=1 Tax=Pseudocercospora musae TaxID=113226 RepID=A0A139I5B2_9PEZI|nr:hypothetical protein AC579_6551 [Pseudocercospora musae]
MQPEARPCLSTIAPRLSFTMNNSMHKQPSAQSLHSYKYFLPALIYPSSIPQPHPRTSASKLNTLPPSRTTSDSISFQSGIHCDTATSATIYFQIATYARKPSIMPLDPQTITIVLQQFLFEQGIPRSITGQITCWDILESAREIYEVEQLTQSPTPATVPAAQQPQQPPAGPPSSSPRDSVIDASASHSASVPAAEVPLSTPAAPEALESSERNSPLLDEDDDLFGPPDEDFTKDSAAEHETEGVTSAQAASEASEVHEREATPEGEDSELFGETARDHMSDSALDRASEGAMSTQAPSEGRQSIRFPGVLTSELTALEPSATALSADPKRFKAKEVALKDCIEYIILRLAAVCITLVRHNAVQKAIAFGQFAVDLYGQGIFASALSYYENAAFQDEYALDDEDEDEIELAKRCIADCIAVLGHEWHDQKRMATKLHNIAVAEQMYHDPAQDSVAPVSQTPARAIPPRGVTKKKIEKKRRDSAAPVKGLARKVQKNRANRAKIVRAGYDEDEWQ